MVPAGLNSATDGSNSTQPTQKNLPTDALVDAFCFLNRSQLDALCLSSRRFCHLISLKMAALCLRSVDRFYLTFVETERCYKLKAIPTDDGEHFGHRGQADDVFGMVPKVLRSAYVKIFTFGHVALSDGLCKSTLDVAHTIRIDELELGHSYDNGFVQDRLSSPLRFFKMLEGFQHLRYLRVNKFQGASAFFRDRYLEHFRHIQGVYIRDSAFTEKGILNYYFYDDKPKTSGQDFSLGVDVSERFVVSFAQSAAASTCRLFPFDLRIFYATRQQTAGSHLDLPACLEATVDETNVRFGPNFRSVYKLSLDEKATLFCAVDKEIRQGSDEGQALSTIFTMEVRDE